MTIVEAVRLIKDKRPEALSADELEALRHCVEHNPSIYGLAGGRDQVHRYLDEAAAGIDTRVASDSASQDDSQSTAGTPDPKQMSGYRPLVELAVILLIASAIGGGAYWYLVPSDETHRNTADAGAKDMNPELDQHSTTAENDSRKRAKSKWPELQTDACPGMPPPDDTERRRDWRGWSVYTAKSTKLTRESLWETSDPANPKSLVEPVTRGGKVFFRATKKVEAARASLKLRLAAADEVGSEGTLEVRVDGQLLAKGDVDAGKLNVPIYVRLAPFVGKAVCLQVAYTPKDKTAGMKWQQMTLADRVNPRIWTVLVPDKIGSEAGTKLEQLPDGSILASGECPPIETYLITTRIKDRPIRAIRLEALPHVALPGGGPGRGPAGEFTIARFEAERRQPGPTQERLKARYVRVELRGQKRVLMIAEVQVFSGAKNVAQGKPATQSSALHGGVARKAVDGYTRGRFKQQSVTHTANEKDPWWAVDLGRDFEINRLAIWNRDLPSGAEIKPYRLVLLNSAKQVVWQHDEIRVPEPSIAYGPFGAGAVGILFNAAVATSETEPFAAGQMIQTTAGGRGWTPNLEQSRAAAVVFKLAADLAPSDQPVTFRVVHRAGGQNLGRFRLLISHDDPPEAIEVPGVELKSKLPDH